jgi:hypothetical protein
LRRSNLLYPFVNGTHITGLVLLFGAIVPLDLRLMGFWRSVPLPTLARVLVPVAIFGLVTALLTGAFMFSSQAVKYSGMGIFQLKLALVAAATMNALFLHRTAAWGTALAAPTGRIYPRLAVSGALSIVLWLGALLCGRFIAYYA